METIAITLPYFYPHEAKAITTMLRRGEVSRVHLRKPGCKADCMAALIAQIPAELRERIAACGGDVPAPASGVGCGSGCSGSGDQEEFFESASSGHGNGHGRGNGAGHHGNHA